jgi:hypothetical protein
MYHCNFFGDRRLIVVDVSRNRTEGETLTECATHQQQNAQADVDAGFCRQIRHAFVARSFVAW